MKTALIPPIPELGHFGHGSLHLLLAHLGGDDRYARHYRTERASGAYTILDNGAHENKSGMAPRLLVNKAVSLRAAEIVLPDTLFDTEDTIRRTHAAISYFSDEGQDDLEMLQPRMMLVAQGSSIRDWRTCFQSQVWSYEAAMRRRPNVFQPPVIGISKDYEMFDGGIPALLESTVIPTGYDIHLLGWGRKLEVLGEMATRWPQIRSTDSAKPFVYAIAGVELGLGDYPAYPTRAADYFETTLTDEQRRLARHNVEVFRQTAEGWG